MHIHIGTRGSARLSAVISVPLYVIPVVDQIRTQHPTSTFSLYSAHTHRHRHIQGVNCKPAIACTSNINKSLVNTCSPNAFTLSFPVSPILSLPVPPLHHLSSHRTNETDDKRFWERFERLNIRLYLNALKWGIFTHNNMHLQFYHRWWYFKIRTWNQCQNFPPSLSLCLAHFPFCSYFIGSIGTD